MNYQMPILGPDGQIRHDPMFYDEWVIGTCCSYYLELLYDLPDPASILHQFKQGAAALAAEVTVTGYDWNHASRVYAFGARQAGLDKATLQNALDLAWRWSGEGYRHWAQLSRSFFFDPTFGEYYHLPTGEALDPCDFHALFQHLSPDPEWRITDFLQDADLIVSVWSRTSKGAEREFFGTRGCLGFNEGRTAVH